MKHEMYCTHCRFYCRADYEGPMDAHEHIPPGTFIAAEGECRRYPPCQGKTIRVNNAERRLLGDWPLVDDEFWCGEFQPRHSDADKSPHDAPHRNENDASTPNAHSGA